MKYQITDQGNGRFALEGAMTFDTVAAIMRKGEKLFGSHTRIEVDLAGVTDTDSAGLALLLEWITWANHTVREIRFSNMPDRIDAIAKTTEVDHLLKRGERWAGFIDAPAER